ncbi:hypothetical protein VZC37_04775 [Gordonia sp. LSe1-13]|uniref:Mce-associated membrane protein n=1 Tax=Gordonia sesuvii TaxID=3116777 RepID=A0ABU7M943_9ACTN|nr:hypothetical protein [Gordonia sp. LSe1-13]
MKSSVDDKVDQAEETVIAEEADSTANPTSPPSSADVIANAHEEPTKQKRQLSISLSTALIAIVITALLVAVTVLAFLYAGTRSDLAADRASAADRATAEKIASDYAVGAATTDYQDLEGWFERLRGNTTPQLAAKFDATASQLQQILVPLNWVSKASPVAATVSSENGGVYKVNAFVNVNSTSKQAPEGVTTTVTYDITVDENADWQISDVGGLDGIVPN